MLRMVIAAILVVTFVADVSARPRRRRGNYNRPNRTVNYSYGSNYNNLASYYSGGPQAVASTKASQAASRGIKGHLGGGFGGGNAEGVGFSTYSAQNALNNCCFTGQRTVAGSSVVRGGDGWYAVKIYW